MNALFEYSLLKYVHSISLGEGLNVGILFYFPSSGRLIFRVPKYEKRVRAAFPNADLEFLGQRLNSFSDTARQFSGKYPKTHLLHEIVETHFQIWESSPLQFSPCATALQTAPDEDTEADRFLDFYFCKFLEPTPKADFVEEDYFRLKKRNASDVLRLFKKLILSKEPDFIERLQKPKVIRNEHSIFVPDVVWQNGTLNAVKAISLDQTSEVKIIDQALLLHSKLNYLKETAETENIRFDILVGKPIHEKFFKDYQNALEILHEIEAKKLIIEDHEIEQYSAKTIEEAED